MKRLLRPSISWKLFAAYSLLFLILMGSSFYAVSRTVNRRVEQLIITDLENAADTAAEIIRNYARYTTKARLERMVDTAITVIELIDERHSGRPSDQNRQRVEDYLLSHEIGSQGYFYVIDRQGVLQVHPYEELRGQNITEFHFVRKQMEQRTGYLEYEWRNPGEERPRAKVLYMDYYEPWDWIVTASAYKEELSSLVQQEELRDSITQMRQGKTGYTYVIDLQGNLVFHPSYEGRNYRVLEKDEGLDLSFFEEMIRRKNGYLSYQWTDDVYKDLNEKMVFFKYLPEFGWIIASSISLEDYGFIFRQINTLLLTVLGISVLLYLILSWLLAVMMTRPICSLIRFMDAAAGSDYSARIGVRGRDETARLAASFNRFLEDLQRERKIRLMAEENNRILAQFPEENPSPVVRVDEQGIILYANPEAQRLFAHWELNPADPLPGELWEQILRFKDSFGSFEYERLGSSFDIQVNYFSSHKAFYLFFVDISEKKQAQARLLLSESVFANSLEGILVTDLDGKIERVNRAFIELTGYQEEELIGRKPSIIKSGLHPPRFYTEMWNALLTEGHWGGEIWNRRKSGESYPVLLMINSILDDRGQPVHYVGLARDISDLKASEEKLRHQAYHDALTGLPNRVLVQDRLSQALAYADRSGGSLGILFLDLDNFKTINDSRGHNVGDHFLQEIARRLKTCCRDEDTVARLGGDEFVVLMPGLKGKEDGVEVALRLKTALAEPVLLDGYELHPSASMGISYYPDDGHDAQLLMKNADLAMYQSKRMGKGMYSLFDASMEKEINLRMELDVRMRKALTAGEFRIAYQPKVSAADGRVSGAEALIRWERKEGEFVPPGDFIPLAEENGFILQLGDWILKQVLEDMAAIREAGGEDLELAVNLSARQFRDRDLIERIDGIVRDSGQPHGLLNFEITENMAMEHSGAALKIVEELYRLGVRISIDDFGTGYSSLSYLRDFKTHVLKIDKAFIDPLPGDPKGSSLVGSIIDIGHSMGMSVVAEGVEDEEQFRFLREAGCDTIQGYYFSRPLFLPDLLDYLKSQA